MYVIFQYGFFPSLALPALTLFAAITTTLANRHVGGLALRIATWVSVLVLALVSASLFP